MTQTKKTALNAVVKELGGRMVEFAGWEMPVQFSGIIDEHNTVRTAAGLFDVSHMGEIEFRGDDALRALQKLVCNDVSKMSIGQAMYTGMLYPNGTFVDDLLVHKIADDYYMLCVNAGNSDKDFAWVKENTFGNVDVTNASLKTAQIALQGPKASRILQKITPVDLSQIRYYWFTHGSVAGVENLLIAATGYTGERGFEIYVPNERAEHIFREMMKAGEEFGIKPTGLGARDTLRLEAGMMLYGNDIDDTTTPLEANLSWIVKMDAGDFIGREALQKQIENGIKRRLVGFEMLVAGIPRHGYEIHSDGAKVGYVTSGTMAPFLKKPIGLGYVPVELTELETELDIMIRGRAVRAKVVATPFYKRPRKKKRIT
ncbi:MAG TPA: glycine cleavage system aminomethyltransferase GcvT [bacterium]|nr:glycine cleavage system aminomethyltransferase GcvT [bacterium]